MWTNTGGISSDPKYISPATYNYALQSNSPDINSGAFVGINSDYLGNPIYGTPDIGAFEYYPQFNADINGDGTVDLQDFGILKDNFGNTGATWAMGDINGDGMVDLQDFSIMKDHFGQVR